MLNIRKVLAMMLAAVLLLSLAACTQPADSAEELNQLQAENEQLRSQVAQLEAKIQELEAGSIADWSLTGKPLVQGSGAEVTLTVTPARYQEGQLVSFRVHLDGQLTAELYCDWDGTAYIGTVELDAADGYSYSLLLTEPSGAQEYRELNSPANPVDAALVYMYSSLSASCSLTITDWTVGDDSLAIGGGSVDIRLPRMTSTGEKAECSGISLVLQLDGQELSRKNVMIPQTEESTICIPLSATAFEIPALEEGSQLDLWLEVILSDGQTLTHSGNSWFFFEGELIQSVG